MNRASAGRSPACTLKCPEVAMILTGGHGSLTAAANFKPFIEPGISLSANTSRMSELRSSKRKSLRHEALPSARGRAQGRRRQDWKGLASTDRQGQNEVANAGHQKCIASCMLIGGLGVARYLCALVFRPLLDYRVWRRPATDRPPVRGPGEF